MKTSKILLLVVLCTFVGSTMTNKALASLWHLYKQHKVEEQDLNYYKQAANLNDILFREGVPVRMQVAIKVLREIDKQLPKYYPKGPFTRNDFIALAWVESEFRQYEIGTHREKGLFQIMPNEFHEFDITKNYYDVDINTDMAFKVLTEKYKHHKDYKLAIMAYNGLVRNRNVKYSEKYWRAFQRRKIAVDLILGEK